MHLEKFQYNKHKSLLEKYYQHSDTPINNRSEKMFKPWLWDDKNGACWLIIDSSEIVATYACLKIEFNKNVAIKKSMRLHIRSDYHQFFNKIFIFFPIFLQRLFLLQKNLVLKCYLLSFLMIQSDLLNLY